MDGSPACPFVAFDDDRDARADRPDHRHRCFAEAEPAPRALAHQEAYCLSSAFPVCPTFQAWARREAAQARTDKAAADATAAAAAAGASVAAAGGAGSDDDRSGSGAEEWTPGPGPEDDLPVESRPRRNPPRDWAAPPPWATGTGGGATVSARSSGAPRPVDPIPDPAPSTEAPSFLAPPPRSTEGQGLAGSAADRLANGELIADVMPATGPPGAARPADLPSSAPDPDLAGLVGGAAAVGAASAGARPATPMTDEQRAAAGYPPSTRSGRRPAVSSTRSAGRSQDKASPQLEHVQHDGPSWEHARRYEAYPTIKTRSGFGGMPGLPRVALLAGALGIAALALFFLPALLGIGGGGATPSASPSATPRVTASPSATPVPEPTPQVYVIKEGDTLSKIAKT